MTSRTWLTAAAALGLLHAASSASWASGGTWLLDTVGPWAVAWRDRAPVQASLVLLLITLVKVGVALGPLLLRRAAVLWWSAAVVLTAYGALNTVGAWLALTGVTDSPAADPGHPSHPALLGHAWLWDPLFAAWGVLLAVGLSLTSARRGPAVRPAHLPAPSPDRRRPSRPRRR